MRRRGPEPEPGLPEIRYTPGMADELMRELAPLLAEEGVDLDNIGVDDLAMLQAAIDRAIERRNMELFTPVGQARDYALATLRLFVEAIEDDETDLAAAVLESVPPESPDGKATVAGCIGVALDLLDSWLGGRASAAPVGLARATRLPAGHWTGERAATDAVALAAKGRAFSSLHSLNVRHGGLHLLFGSALAVAAALQAWADLAGTSVTALAGEHVGPGT
jgi:hypothetical protein